MADQRKSHDEEMARRIEREQLRGIADEEGDEVYEDEEDVDGERDEEDEDGTTL